MPVLIVLLSVFKKRTSVNCYKHIVVFGYPRSGTTLLYCMLRSSVEGYKLYHKEVSAREAYEKEPNVAKITKDPRDAADVDWIVQNISDVGLILCVRDPRSMLVSRVDKDSHFKMSWDHCHHRKEKPSAGLIEFHDWILNSMKYSPLVVRYEELIESPENVQGKIGERFELEYKDEFRNFYKYEIPPLLGCRLNGIRPVMVEEAPWKNEQERIEEQFTQCAELFDIVQYWGYEETNAWFINMGKEGILKKRFDFLNKMIRRYGFEIGAEVGTGTGKTAMEILKANPTLSLIEVAYYPGPNTLPSTDIAYCTCQKAKRLWQRRMRMYPGRVKVLPEPSHLAVKHVKDNSLDFVFIDADHSYKECLRDIKVWIPKVKKGGLICGHDFEHAAFPGIKKAVEEVFGDDFQKTYDRIWFTWKREAS